MTAMPESEEYAGVPTVGITGTYYTGPGVRFEQALATAENWQYNGLPLVVVDASPENENGNHWVKQALRQRGAVVLQATVAGIASQRQQGAEYALMLGAETILTHEPEKVSTPSIAGDVVRELATSGIVIVGRTEKSLETLPPVQRRTEALAGWILNRSYGLPEDALAGPRGYTASTARDYLLPYPSHHPGMNNWIYMYKNPLDSMKNGGKIGGVNVDLIYPQSMTAEETGNEAYDRKRYEQLRLQLKYLFDTYQVFRSFSEMRTRIASEIDSMGDDMPTSFLEKQVQSIVDISSEYGFVDATNQM